MFQNVLNTFKCLLYTVCVSEKVRASIFDIQVVKIDEKEWVLNNTLVKFLVLYSNNYKQCCTIDYFPIP